MTNLPDWFERREEERRQFEKMRYRAEEVKKLEQSWASQDRMEEKQKQMDALRQSFSLQPDPLLPKPDHITESLNRAREQQEERLKLSRRIAERRALEDSWALQDRWDEQEKQRRRLNDLLRDQFK